MSAIATVAELKAELGKESTDDDDLLQRILDSAELLVENYCNRQFHPNPPLDVHGADTADPVQKTIYLPPAMGSQRPRGSRIVAIPYTREIVTVVGQTAQFSAFQPLGDPPWIRLYVAGLSVSGPLPSLLITGRFGFSPAPPDLKDAVLSIASRRWRERDAGYGDAVVLQDGATVNYFRQFQPTVKATLDSYRKLMVE